jgi:hypothetical protein
MPNFASFIEINSKRKYYPQDAVHQWKNGTIIEEKVFSGN